MNTDMNTAMSNFEREDDEVTVLEDEPKKDLYQEVEILFDGRGQQVEGGEDVTGAHNNKHEARGRVKNADHYLADTNQHLLNRSMYGMVHLMSVSAFITQLRDTFM